MTYALIELQKEEKLFQRILIDQTFTEKEHNVIRQIVACIQEQIDDIICVLA